MFSPRAVLSGASACQREITLMIPVRTILAPCGVHADERDHAAGVAFEARNNGTDIGNIGGENFVTAG